jgi:protein tyrosine/serine phosphatase
MKKMLRSSLLTLIAIVSFGMIASAQTSPSNFQGISIANFGKMDDNFYRGAQPTESDYKALAAFGIHTIIDLRNDYEPFAKSAAEAAGLKYYLIPMNGISAPTDQDVAQFLKIANDPETGKFYVHCKAGIHRTGTMGAVYRITHDGWDYNKAYAEMKDYGFSAGLFHGKLKSFVKKYAGQTVALRAANTTKTAPIAAGMSAAPAVAH